MLKRKCLSGIILFLVVAASFFFYQVEPAYAQGYEDFTEADWIEVDPAPDNIHIINSTYLFAKVSRDEHEYVYKNYTASDGIYFDDFEHQFEFNINASLVNSDYSQTDTLSNYTGSRTEHGVANEPFITVYFSDWYGANYWMGIIEYDGATVTSDKANMGAGAVGVHFYVTYVKVGVETYCEVRTGSHSGSLVQNFTLTLTTDYSFQLLYILNGLYSGVGGTFKNQHFNLWNLALEPVSAPDYSDVGETNHWAGEECTFHANWTEDGGELSHWIFGSNMSETFTNNTAVPFNNSAEVLLESSDTSGGAAAFLSNAHPAASGGLSSTGEGATLTHWLDHNITTFSASLYRYFSPNFNIMIGIYQSDYPNPNSYPNRTWSNIENSSKIAASSLTPSFAWYNFTFAGTFRMATGSYYMFQILVVDYVSGSIAVQFNNPSSNPNPYPYGNEAVYSNGAWNAEYENWDMEFRLYGRQSSITSWSNATATLPVQVGVVVEWCIWANNTLGLWNNTGFQYFTTVGVNITFYFNTGGYFYVELQSMANATTTGYLNGSTLGFIGVGFNASFYWQSFNWSGGSQDQNIYGFTISAKVDIDIWCYFAPAPEAAPQWLADLTNLPNWDLVVMLIVSMFFTALFLIQKAVAWGAVSFASWLISGFVWLFINPVSYAVALLFSGIAIVILTLTLILQLEAAKVDSRRSLAEERMTPV